MNTFDSLEFSRHPNMYKPHSSKRAVVHFDNGWGVSVLLGESFYSNGVDTYELAVLYKNNLHYDNPVADGDVCAYLSKSQVTELMRQVQGFSCTEADVVGDYEDLKAGGLFCGA
jgi:hypothetical protein